MTTIPMMIEEPTRFGSPQDPTCVEWREFEKGSAYECRVLVCPEESGGFSVHALRLPGVVSQGDTVDEAIENIVEAFRGALSVYLEEPCALIPWKDEDSDVDRPAGSMERWILVDV